MVPILANNLWPKKTKYCAENTILLEFSLVWIREQARGRSSQTKNHDPLCKKRPPNCAQLQ